MSARRYLTKRLSTCNVSDATDRLVLKGIVSRVLPLEPSCPKLTGPALTIKKIEIRIKREISPGVSPMAAHELVRYDFLTKET